MLITTVVADAFATKCYLLAPRAGAECVIVDPGFGVAERLAKTVADLGLRPTGVLLTHGHLDHTRSVGPVCAAYGVPAYIHPADNGMLSDPLSGLGPEFTPEFEQILGPCWRWEEPSDVRALRGGTVLELAGLELAVDHTPGHTPGSVMFNLRDATSDQASDQAYCLVGDVLYAGSIGRTDMPGGNRGQTLTSLKSVLAKPDETLLLTGHGDDSTVGVERHANPFMRQAATWEAPA